MTSGKEMNTPDSRRDLRTTDARATSATSNRSRTKNALFGTFGALAVAGFIAAYVVPTGAALADQPGAVTPTVSAYSLSVEGAQTLVVNTSATSQPELARDASNYEAYVTPTPTPTPTQTAQVASDDSSSDSSSSADYAPPTYSGGGSPSEWMAAAGIAASDYGYVDYIVTRESGWNPNATNSSSGACGLVQALPCSKVPGGGYDPVANLQWANGYAVGRYGSWAGAYAFWVSNNWW